MNKINHVLLIDDDDVTRMVNNIFLKKSNLIEKISTTEDAESALKLLKNLSDSGKPFPDIIFLDINMPKMDGWEFIEHYQKFRLKDKEQASVYMLSASVNPEDIRRIEGIPDILKIISKPLTTRSTFDFLNNFIYARK